MLDRLTDRAKDVMSRARNEAQDLGNASLLPEHVLLGILDGGGSALSILMGFGVDPDRLREDVRAEVDSDTEATVGPMSVGARAQMVFLLAEEECGRMNRRVVATEHLLLGVIGEGGSSSAVLARHGARPEAIREKARATTVDE